MEEGKLNQEKPSKKTKFNFITNPTLMGWIAIIGLPLGAWGIYLSYAFNKEAKPVYSIMSDVTITKRGENSKIKVFYDSVEVEEVRTVTIAFWNAGNDFLDKQAFSRDYPLSIQSTKPVRILEAKVISTTRPTLKLLYNLKYIKNQKKSKFYNGINFEIEGDEGLEAGDGALIQIIYAGKSSWVVDGRIKGIPQGFKQIVEPQYKYSRDNMIIIAIGDIMLVVVYQTLKRFFRRSLTIQKIIFWVCVLILLSSYAYFIWNIKKGVDEISQYELLPEKLRTNSQKADSSISID